MSSTPEPFEVHIADDAIEDLRARLAATRWPEPLPGTPWARGVPVDYLRDLAAYWASEFDWRAAEDRINAVPQFRTTIDGQNIHFVHVRSPHAGAVPLLLLHGWPGSFVEFLDVIGPLTDPAAHDLDPSPAFHVVIPSIPGFTFSTPLSGEGWTSARSAAAFVSLMRQLGYDRFGVQGGDLGAVIGPEVGRAAPDSVIGVHVNAATFGFIPLGPVSDDELESMSDVERARMTLFQKFNSEMSGYMQQQSTRPVTLSYGLTDSPAGQLAWIVEKFKEWTASDKELPEDAVDRDTILTNVSLYWFTATAASSANAYYEDTVNQQWPDPSSVPTGVAAFGQDVAIRRFSEQLNTNITRWSDFAEGGHFAALETPGLLVDDVRAFFAELT